MADVGEVRYKAKVDDSGVDQDIAQTEKKIEESAKSVQSKIESAAKKASQSVSDGAKQASENISGATKESDKFADALGKVKDGNIGKLNTAIEASEKALDDVNEALDKTPKGFNAFALASEKVRLTKQEISDTKEKLKELKTAQDQAKEAFENGEISKDTYKAISREVLTTKSDLKELKSEGKDALKELANTNPVVSGFKKIGSAVGSVSIAAIKGIGTAFIGMSTAAATGVAALTKVALENYAEYEQLVGGVETLFGESASKVEAYADQAYKTAGISANDYMSTVTSFSASLLQSLGGDTEAAAEYANRAVIDMADNANKMGTSMEDIQNAYQGFAKQNYTMLDNLKLGYGGTQEEMQRLIKDASEMTDVQEKLGVTVDSSSMSFGNIVNAISVMQESMGIAGTTAAEASTTIEGSVNSMKAAWTNLTVGIADENANVDELLAQFVDSVAVAAGNILPRVQTILDGIASLMDGLPPIVAQALEALLAQAPQFVQTALSLVSSFLSAIRESAPQIIESGIEAVMTLADGLLEMAPELISTAGELVASLINGIANHFPEILQTAVKLIAAFVSGLGQAYPQIIASLGNLAASMVSAILSTNWLQVGKDIIGGIINGVGAMGGALVDAARNVAKSALDSIKSFFGIASPSKVMRDQVGKQLDAGIGVGIEQNADMATDPAELVGKSIASSFALDFNYNMPNTDGLLRDVSAGINLGATAQTQITVPVTIDGREVARATAWYMGEQLAWEER